VLPETVGFWTPEYLEAKLATLRSFAGHRILLAVASPARETLPDLSADAIPYKSALRVQDVLDRLEEGPVAD
jgi:predicted nuclease of restriction endonuclease-like RecB superfamily